MLCWDGVVEMWGVLGQGCPPAWGAAHSLAERGVFIYYLWRVGALPGHGGGRRTVLVLVGQRVPPGSHQHILALLVSRTGLARPQLWQVAVGAGTGLVALGPWARPLGGHRGVQGEHLYR